MKIKAYTGFNERKNIQYYDNFEVIEKLPKIGDSDPIEDYAKLEEIEEVELDANQPNDEVYNYNYYYLYYRGYDEFLERDQEFIEKVAIKK